MSGNLEKIRARRPSAKKASNESVNCGTEALVTMPPDPCKVCAVN